MDGEPVCEGFMGPRSHGWDKRPQQGPSIQTQWPRSLTVAHTHINYQLFKKTLLNEKKQPCWIRDLCLHNFTVRLFFLVWERELEYAHLCRCALIKQAECAAFIFFNTPRGKEPRISKWLPPLIISTVAREKGRDKCLSGEVEGISFRPAPTVCE